MTEVVLNRSRERLAVIALAFGAFVVTVNVSVVGALIPFLREDSLYSQLAPEVAKTTIGQLVWVASGAGALAALLLGPWIDAAGRRGPMVVGGLLTAIGLAMHGIPGDHRLLLAARAIAGFGGGLAFTSASAAVADLVPFERRAAAMGVFSMGLFLATPVGLPLAILIARTGGDAWRFVFVGLAVPAVLAVAGYLALLPAGLGRSRTRVSQLQVLTQPGAAAALASVLLYTGAFFTTVQLAADWLDESALLVRDRQWIVWVGLGLFTAAGSLVLPRFADRAGKRNTVLLTTAGVAVCLAFLARVDGMVGLVAVGLPLSLLGAARTPSLQALMSEIVEPRMRGTLMGLRAAAVNLGGAVFMWQGSAVYAAHGFHTWAMVAAATMVFAYLTIRWFVRVDL